MKYQTIYDLVYRHHFDSITDCKNEIHPFWLILEHKKLNLRIWVTGEHNCLRITTAQLDLPCDSKEYSQSIRRYNCGCIGDMEAKLAKNLLPLYTRDNTGCYQEAKVDDLKQLKRRLTVGSRFRVLRYRKPELAGSVRIVNIAHKNGLYTVQASDLDGPVSTCNGGKGTFLSFEAVSHYRFGDTIEWYSGPVGAPESELIMEFSLLEKTA